MYPDLIFNGTGINYSWHFPKLFDLVPSDFPKYPSMTFISGGSTGLLVHHCVHRRIIRWREADFLNWSRRTSRAYRTGILSGLVRMARLKLGSKQPIFTQSQSRDAWADAVEAEFFDWKFKEFPSNIRIPLVNLETNQIEVATPQSHFGEYPAFLISFAATAIPTIYPEIRLGQVRYGDVTFSKAFLPWLKDTERNSPHFVNYNLLKSKEFPNGRYIKICDHPHPKKMMQVDNLKFIFGRDVPSYAENVRKSKLLELLK